MTNSTNLAETVSATVMFNLAITVHLDAMERIQLFQESSTCKDSKRNCNRNNENTNNEEEEDYSASAEDQLQRAIRLYQFAHTVYLGLHETCDDDFGHDCDNEYVEHDSTVDDYVLVLCCIVNNLGHIHRTLNEIDTADRYFEHLLSLLMYCMNGIGVGDYSSTSSTSINTTSATTTTATARFLEQFLDSTVYLIHGGPTKSPAPAA